MLCFLSNLKFENCNRLIVSVAWVAHIIIYLLIDPPLSPFLNEVFIKLDDVWGMLENSGYFSFLQLCIIIDTLYVIFIQLI